MLPNLAQFFGYTAEQMAQLFDEMAADSLAAADAYESILDEINDKDLDGDAFADCFYRQELLVWLDGYLTAAYRAAAREGLT